MRETESWHKAQVKCTRTDQLEIDWRSYGLPLLYCSDSEGWWHSTWSGTSSCFLGPILLKRATEDMSCKIFFSSSVFLKIPNEYFCQIIQNYGHFLKWSLQRTARIKLAMRKEIIVELTAEVSRLGSSSTSFPCGGVHACLGLSFSGYCSTCGTVSHCQPLLNSIFSIVLQ